MAILDSFTQLGNKEDLIDVITRVAVEETPFLSAIGKKKATGVLHEWMTETLDSPAANKQIEGSAAAFGSLTPRVRLGNYCQIARKTGSVSKTQEAVSKAGVASEYAHQLQKASTELARDIERAHWQGTKAAGASASAGRGSGGVFYWVSTNRQSMSNASGADLTGTAQAGAAATITVAAGAGASCTAGDHILLTGGTGQGQYRVIASLATDVATVSEAWDVVPDSTSTYIVYTVPVALSEAILNDGIQAAKDAGGAPNAIYVSGKQKRAISGFAQGIRRVSDSGKKLTNSIDVYDSDFGAMAVKYDRWTPVGTAAILEEKKFNTAFLRPVVAEELAKVGSSRDFMVEAEFTLESLSENASALVAGAAL
jgi:hypothetical protein